MPYFLTYECPRILYEYNCGAYCVYARPKIHRLRSNGKGGKLKCGSNPMYARSPSPSQRQLPLLSLRDLRSRMSLRLFDLA